MCLFVGLLSICVFVSLSVTFPAEVNNSIFLVNSLLDNTEERGMMMKKIVDGIKKST